MRRTCSLILVSMILLAGCRTQAPFTDLGTPGKIKAFVFYDDNKNGISDAGETGFQARMGISQDVSCPPSNLERITFLDTDPNGVALFADLKPGRYCVFPDAIPLATSKMTMDVYVSSDKVSTASFGIARP